MDAKQVMDEITKFLVEVIQKASSHFRSVRSFYGALKPYLTSGTREKDRKFKFLDEEEQRLRTKQRYVRDTRIVFFVALRVLKDKKRFPNIPFSIEIKTAAEEMIKSLSSASNAKKLQNIQDLFGPVIVEQSDIRKNSTALFVFEKSAVLCVSNERFRFGKQVSPSLSAI